MATNSSRTDRLRDAMDLASKLDLPGMDRVARKLGGVISRSEAFERSDDDGMTVAIIAKGERTHVRVSLKPWSGGRAVVLRLWKVPADGTDFARTRRHFSIDIRKVDELIEALQRAKAHA